MNKIVKYSILGIACVLLVFIFIYVKKFIIGNSSYEDIDVSKVTVGNNITIEGRYTNSSLAYKDYEYTLVGKELYVEIKNVLVSSKYNKGEFTIVIPLNSDEVDNIHLTNNKSTKVIYEKSGL